MYSIKISNKNYDMLDFYDVSRVLQQFGDKRERFPAYFSEKIEEYYEDTFLKNDFGYLERELYSMQFLIDHCYNYILSGKKDFVNYYDSKLEEVKDLEKDSFKKFKVKSRVCFNPDEIEENINEIDSKNLDLFYYFSFTSFFLNEYLLEIFVMFSEQFCKDGFNKNELNLLNSYLMKIFSVEFSEAFKNFESSLLSVNEEG